MKQIFTSLFLILSWGISAQTFDSIEVSSGFDIFHSTQGIATADYDNDGDLDVFIVAKNDFDSSQPHTWSRLMRNNNDGTFTDVTVAAGFYNLYNFDQQMPGQEYGVKMGASWGDYDNDGNPDLFLTNLKRLQLFRNNGNGTFVEVTSFAGIPTLDDCYHTSALWWDFNGDGFLDIYVSKWSECLYNSYFENNGNGTFTDKTSLLGIGGLKEYTWMAVPIDVNNDNLWDLYLANDFEKNELFVQNPNGTFTEQGAIYNLDEYGYDMGITIGDYNNNGEFDLFVTTVGDNRLFTPNANSYDNQAKSMGIDNAHWAWATQFSDFDLDGDEDLFVANGYEMDLLEYPTLKYNFLFKNQHIEGQVGFTDISQATGINEFGNSMCANVFDYDVDGDLDLLVSNTHSPPFFYENKTTVGDTINDPNWVVFKLIGTTSNVSGLGSEVTIWTNSNTQHRFYTGASLHSQSLQGVHFGLGAATVIDSMAIKWDLGLVEKYYNLPTKKYIQLIEGQAMTVLNLQNQKIYGCTDPNSCTYNPLATVNDNSCTYLPSVPISGNLNSGYLKKEIYTCTENMGSTYFWKVENGEILSGQGTATVEVLWHLADSASISVQETASTCESERSTIQIDLSLADMDESHSIARLWNEALLYCIRRDYARPTVHARNLFHTSVGMYDAWAIYDDTARTYLIGNNVDGFSSDFNGFTTNLDRETAQKETISFVMFRLLNHRFLSSPAYNEMRLLTLTLMNELGYDESYTSTDYSTGEPAALGNFIAETIINFGMQDGANELQDYANTYYSPVNPPLITNNSGGVDSIVDPNRWQPLSFETFIDQSGNLIDGSTPDFLSPEWGNVVPFSLKNDVRTTHQRNNNTYYVFHEPPRPPYLDTLNSTPESDLYKWNFSLVSIWSSHLSPYDSVLWDISPGGIGNINILDMPTNFADYQTFYKTLEGGDIGEGWAENPTTQQPYPPQIVPRGDYARVLAEFWADGPDSETPPGHWFTILNTVNEHPLLVKKLQGEGAVLNNLEWDVKAYFILGGTMHDAAITAWSVKGWYDYIRPISAIRYMAERGQSSDPNLPNYDVGGIQLIPNLIEQVEAGDALAGVNNQHIGKIKLYAWKGHPFILNTDTDEAGVGWILAEDWMPYQRISFVTPPFAGYVSGHSTFSRAAAEAMTLLTGDAYFPGGVGEFIARKNEFLVFEQGPSVDVILQWATYRDASDQCSLSRIWGGIHPPADDIPGRLMGEKVGQTAFNFAIPYFTFKPEPIDTTIIPPEPQDSIVPSVLFPNPAQPSDVITLGGTTQDMTFQVFDIQGREVKIEFLEFDETVNTTNMKLESVNSGIYIIQSGERIWKLLVL